MTPAIKAWLADCDNVGKALSARADLQLLMRKHVKDRLAGESAIDDARLAQAMAEDGADAQMQIARAQHDTANERANYCDSAIAYIDQMEARAAHRAELLNGLPRVLGV